MQLALMCVRSGVARCGFDHQLKDVGRDKFSLIPTIKSQWQFFSKNLVDAQQPIPLEAGQCQLIVCNNVLIYFRQFEQRDIVRYLARYLIAKRLS